MYIISLNKMSADYVISVVLVLSCHTSSLLSFQQAKLNHASLQSFGKA